MDKNKFNIILGYLFQIVFWFIFLDVVIFRLIFKVGFPYYYESDNYYIQAPYVSYVSRPISRSYLYNRNYDKNISIFNRMENNSLKVAFFAGSTGILGKPNLAVAIEKALTKKLSENHTKKIPQIFVANFSMLSGNSRQHMHMLLEYFDEFKPDIIIFYNGFNELNEPFFEDPRPGYPYNQFYAELPEWKKCLIKYSATFSLLEFHYSILTQKNKLREQINFASDEYKNSILTTYIDTFEKSQKIAKDMDSYYFGKPLFIGVFQPYKENYAADGPEITEKARNEINKFNYIYDLHDEFNNLNQDVWDDFCHVHGEAQIKMAQKISEIVYNELKNKHLLEKFYNN